MLIHYVKNFIIEFSLNQPFKDNLKAMSSDLDKKAGRVLLPETMDPLS